MASLLPFIIIVQQELQHLILFFYAQVMIAFLNSCIFSPEILKISLTLISPATQVTGEACVSPHNCNTFLPF